MGRGDYWREALSRSEQALREGALQPLSTGRLPLRGPNSERFECRVLNSRLPKHLRPAGPKPNPFLPWDPRLAVDVIGDDHVLILNKYPVQTGHMLLITRAWASQQGWLNRADWKALVQIDRDTSGLWFFNSGPVAGASQPHRHLQLLPRTETERICPRSDWFVQQIERCELTARPAYEPLEAACAVQWRQDAPEHNGAQLEAQYRALARALGLGSPETDPLPRHPYNLLLTPQWMALVRRQQESSHGFSINGLGFAGYLLATEMSDLAWLDRHGPEALLQEVVMGFSAPTVGGDREGVGR